ncbi:TrmH family RNA methyltransferase [Keratinibaculum paraultunense]|uniref:TrmH family RNA methyltransferase n=1 Tax=Keratinibaculum paraultunense TaxID=1278232 RepID=A0A4R3KY42_9FIRM|nr:RNA methyltransferase [Keratinibaculum paraultunense]QQY80373.1 RNA methyltransferase [Keratinibaculum paraultunense]TCS90900.1 TrmH family RNA methyltransferase [Keratinibaculum paraultunense]
MKRIESPSNPIIKEIKSLYRKKDRWAKKKFIVEGINIVKECINNNYPLICIIYSDELLNVKGGWELFNRISSHPKLIHITNQLYREISNMENPQGIMGVSEFNINSIHEISLKEDSSLLLLDRLQDPGNMGTIIRSADAFGIDGIIITKGCVDVYNPKVIRSTMGSIFRVPIFYEDDPIFAINKLREEKVKIYATSLEGSIYIYEANFKLPFLLVIGNESSGVSSNIYSVSDSLIKIPMIGDAESLNAAVASSIIMYESIRQRSQ